MALTVATTHTWQTELAAAPDNDSRIMERPTGDNPEVTNQPVNMTSASSVGHGQPSGNQLYHTANPFPPAGSQWTPSPTAAPFYPQFPPFYNAGTPPVAAQPPYFDPNQQLAWYQQMMLQQAMAQQLHQNQFNHAMAELGRVRANSGPQQNDFFQAQGLAHPPPMIPGFPFQSGTPPANPHSGYNGASQPSQQFRRGPQSHHMPGARSNTFDNQDWSRLKNINAPYARPDAAGSSHSVSSSNGSAQASAGGGGARQRTASNNTNSSQTPPSSLRGQSSGSARSSTMPQLTTDFERPGQSPRVRNNSGPPSPASHSRTPHQRNGSNTSDRTISSARGQPPSASPTASSNNPASTSSAAPSSTSSSPNLSPVSRTNQRTPVKPSPLSQQQTFTEPSATSKRAKRLSKDDSELLPPTTVASALSARQSGLKGRFKRALAFNPPSSVDEHTDMSSSVGHGDGSPNPAHGSSEEKDGLSPLTPVAGESVPSAKPKSRAAALFSGKFNASTDNISLSSTVSSASVMIRKLGSIGKLARRNSLMGISSIFKDKNKDKGEGTSASAKKGKKSEKAEASVSHVTAELDRGGGSEDESWQNLTPAARVARQHTIKSNEEAAKRLREQAAASSASSAAAAMTNGANGVPAWEKNTTNRRGEGSGRNVSEDGTLLDDRSDDSGEGGFDPQLDGDATIRIPAGVEFDEEDEPWAVGLRRSIEKTRQPGKAVIRNHLGYIQEQHLDPPNQPFAARIRSNSYQTVSESVPGPLAHLPSPDPDHIDGLQRSNSTSNTPDKPSFSLPVFNFEFGEDIDILPKVEGEGMTYDVLSSSPGALANSADKGPTFAYTHPTANSSAPALSTMFDSKGGPGSTAPTSSLSAMKKSISFAATLSIYDTFSASTYDRRSEPSTANRLTPALAQRIKEELNSFKMEEMEVHSASRIHTHFFV